MCRELKCETCDNKIIKIPRFCSIKCKSKTITQYFKPKFIWHEATKDEQQKHLREYFEKNIIRKDGCWDWKPKARTEKYMRMNFCRTAPKLAVHVYSYQIYKGEIPDRMWVLHKCDNRRCANPDHLFLGTSEDNINDMITKNRNVKGSKHGCSKLTEEQIPEIRNLLSQGISNMKLAKQFGVSKRTIQRIRNGTHWKHVE